jgi:hypothetical protein
MRKTLCKNVFNFICCVAGDNVPDLAMTAEEKFMQFHDQFHLWFEKMSTTEEHVGGILKVFEGCKLPEFFRNYVKEMKVRSTQKWIAKYHFGGESQDKLKRLRFGNIVKDCFDDCRKSINTVANPLWIDSELLPRKISVFAYFYFMRKQIWPSKALENAVNSHRMAKRRKSTKVVDDIGGSINLVPADFDDKWYPDWWLSFVFLGLPAGKRARDALKLNRSSENGVFAVPSRLPVSHRVKKRRVEELSSMTDTESRQDDVRVALEVKHDERLLKLYILVKKIHCYDKMKVSSDDNRYVKALDELTELTDSLK